MKYTKCDVCNGAGLVGIGHGVRGLKKCEACNGAGAVVAHKAIPKDSCPICGALFPTDDRVDFIPEEEIIFCYRCGSKIK